MASGERRVQVYDDVVRERHLTVNLLDLIGDSRFSDPEVDSIVIHVQSEGRPKSIRFIKGLHF